MVCSFLCPADHASASLACRAWRSGACLLVTHLALPLNHPMLLAGPQPGWAELAAQLSAGYAGPGSPGQHGSAEQQQQDANGSGGSTCRGGGGGAGPSGVFHPGFGWPGGGVGPWPGLWAAGGLHGGGGSSSSAAPWGTGAAAQGGGMAPAAYASGAAGAAGVGLGVGSAAHCRPLPRLRTSFPRVCHLTLVHNALIHRHQVHAALATVHALWPGLRGLSVHDR